MPEQRLKALEARLDAAETRVSLELARLNGARAIAAGAIEQLKQHPPVLHQPEDTMSRFSALEPTRRDNVKGTAIILAGLAVSGLLLLMFAPLDSEAKHSTIRHQPAYFQSK